MTTTTSETTSCYRCNEPATVLLIHAGCEGFYCTQHEDEVKAETEAEGSGWQVRRRFRPRKVLDPETRARVLTIPVFQDPINSTTDPKRHSLKSSHVLSIRNGRHRFAVGAVPRYAEGRQVFQGPMVPGPWAYAAGLATVIDNAGGTGAERKRNKEAGREHEVEHGQLIRIDSVIYEVEIVRNEWVKLVVVMDEGASR